jgi:hypothetical protein
MIQFAETSQLQFYYPLDPPSKLLEKIKIKQKPKQERNKWIFDSNCNYKQEILYNTLYISIACPATSCTIRYSVDGWNTFHNQSGQCIETISEVHGQVQVFLITIDIPSTSFFQMEYCFQFSTVDTITWDNNHNQNYRLQASLRRYSRFAILNQMDLTCLPLRMQLY